MTSYCFLGSSGCFLAHRFYSLESKKVMSITSEIRDYFENLIKPLVSNESLEELLSSFPEKIIRKFREKFNEQKEKK